MRKRRGSSQVVSLVSRNAPDPEIVAQALGPVLAKRLMAEVAAARTLPESTVVSAQPAGPLDPPQRSAAGTCVPSPVDTTCLRVPASVARTRQQRTALPGFRTGMG